MDGSANQKERRKQYQQCFWGIVIAAATPLMHTVAIVRGLVSPNEGWFAAWPVLPIIVVLACVNRCFDQIRPLRYQRRHGSMEGYAHTSGVPLFGVIAQTMLVVYGVQTPAPGTALIGLAMCFVDTQSLTSWGIYIWRDAVRQDEPTSDSSQS